MNAQMLPGRIKWNPIIGSVIGMVWQILIVNYFSELFYLLFIQLQMATVNMNIINVFPKIGLAILISMGIHEHNICELIHCTIGVQNACTLLGILLTGVLGYFCFLRNDYSKGFKRFVLAYFLLVISQSIPIFFLLE